MSGKPADIPRWCVDATYTTPGTMVDPPSGKKDIGWIDDEEPSAEYQNWLQFVNSEWFVWIDDIVDNGFDFGPFPADDSTYDLGTASKRWANVYADTTDATTYGLAANYTSLIVAPLGSALTGDIGGEKWTRVTTAGGDEDALCSSAASAQAVFMVQVPENATVDSIFVDWAAHAASPGTKMSVLAEKCGTIPGANGAAASRAEWNMYSGTQIYAQASTDRKWGVITCDQNNSGFFNGPVASGVTYVRILITASTESGGDYVYGVYVGCTHKSVGHLSPAPAPA